MSVCLQTKWLWFRVPLQSLKLQISRLFRTRSSLTFRQHRVWIHCEMRSDMITTHTQMHRTDNYSQHSSIIWPVWLNDWVFVYKLSGCGFESHCSHLYSLVYNSFYQKGPLFVYWSSICTFQTIMEKSFFKCFFDTYCDSVQNNTLLFKKVSSNCNRKMFFNV